MKEFYLEFEADEYELTEENYWETVLKPSKIREKDFENLEHKLGLTLPVSFKDFYKLYYSLEKDLDIGGIYIAGNIENSKLKSLNDYFFGHGISSEITNLGLVPFGLYNDEWYICLDMNENQDNPNIVLFEMSNWREGKRAISHRPWFTNFKSFLKCITDYQTYGNWNNFDKLDPGNNYLTAYDYWNK